MAQYPKPSGNYPIFNYDVYNPYGQDNSGGLTVEEGLKYFLAFPTQQVGTTETMSKVLITGTLGVDGIATFNNNIVGDMNLSIGGDTTCIGNLAVDKTLTINGIGTAAVGTGNSVLISNIYPGGNLISSAIGGGAVQTYINNLLEFFVDENGATVYNGSLDMNYGGIINAPDIYMNNGTSTTFISQVGDDFSIFNDAGNITLNGPTGINLQPNSVNALTVTDTGINAYVNMSMNANSLSDMLLAYATLSTDMNVNNHTLTNAFATTPDPGDDSTSIATTAFVQNAIGSITPLSSIFQTGTISITGSNFPQPIPNQSPNVTMYGGNNFIMIGTATINFNPYSTGFPVVVCTIVGPFAWNFSQNFQTIYSIQATPLVYDDYATIQIHVPVQVSNPSTGIGIPAFNINWLVYPQPFP